MQKEKKIADALPGQAHGLSSLVALKLSSRWLNEFAGNVTSQSGEDGLVAKALSLLPDPTLWCVEFGAWDGKHLSNTFDLVDSKGYNVALIEGDPVKYKELCISYPHKDRAVFANAFVGWSDIRSHEPLIFYPWTLMETTTIFGERRSRFSQSWC
jgi:hypothetical protein